MLQEVTIIETQRLQIQEVNKNDTQFIFDLLNSPGWIQHIGNRGIRTLTDAEAYIQSPLAQSYEKDGFGLYKMVLKEEQKPIGLCGLIDRSDLPHVDIGFAILPQYQGKGYTFEAAKATMEHGQSKLGLEVIWGITGPSNIKSQKLLEKLGLKFLKKIQFGNYEEDTWVYSNEITI